MSVDSSSMSQSRGSDAMADDDSHSHSSEIPSPGSKVTKRKRTCKDPMAPTRPLSAYVLFLIEKQQEFRKTDAEPQQVADITRRVGAAWRALSPDDRKVYEVEAEKRKAKYLQEVAEYEKSDQHRQFIAMKKLTEDSGDTSGPAKKIVKKRKKSTIDSSDGASSVESNERRKPGRPPLHSPSSSSGRMPASSSAHGSRQQQIPYEWSQVSGNPYKNTEKAMAEVDLNGLTEIRVPIFNKEFMDWNTQREKELRQVRHQTHELEIDLAGHQTMKDQEAKIAADITATKKKLLGVNAARKEVVNILQSAFSETPLPSGRVMTNGDVDDYMADLEKTISRSPARHPELMEKIREVAHKLGPFMAHLQ